MSTKHVCEGERKLCDAPNYTALVEVQKDIESHRLGDVDCAECLVRMARTHAALSEAFRARLVSAEVSKKCRVYDAPCVNPGYCDDRGACCAGDPDCRAMPPAAMCHECSEMVEVVDGKLAGHHGMTGEGCPSNGAVVQIYLHPRVAARLAYLEASLVFGGPNDEA